MDVSHCWHAGWSCSAPAPAHVRLGFWTPGRGDMLPGRLLSSPGMLGFGRASPRPKIQRRCFRFNGKP